MLELLWYTHIVCVIKLHLYNPLMEVIEFRPTTFSFILSRTRDRSQEHSSTFAELEHHGHTMGRARNAKRSSDCEHSTLQYVQ